MCFVGKPVAVDINKLALFSIVKKRMNWLSRRQEVLSQNIANSDTPEYKARDLKKFDFKQLVRRQSRQLGMAATRSDHLRGQRQRLGDFAEEKVRRPFETAPGGNSVILEEQMAKINETAINHKLTNDLYRKHLSMIKLALGRR